MTTNEILDEMRRGAILCMGWFDGERQYWLEASRGPSFVRADVGDRLIASDRITPQQDTLFTDTDSQSFVLGG